MSRDRTPKRRRASRSQPLVHPSTSPACPRSSPATHFRVAIVLTGGDRWHYTLTGMTAHPNWLKPARDSLMNRASMPAICSVARLIRSTSSIDNLFANVWSWIYEQLRLLLRCIFARRMAAVRRVGAYIIDDSEWYIARLTAIG